MVERGDKVSGLFKALEFVSVLVVSFLWSNINHVAFQYLPSISVALEQIDYSPNTGGRAAVRKGNGLFIQQSCKS